MEKIGSEAKAAVPALIESLKYGNIYYESKEALNEIGTVSKEEVPALTKALKDENWMVRCNVAQALGKMGPPKRQCPR